MSENESTKTLNSALCYGLEEGLDIVPSDVEAVVSRLYKSSMTKHSSRRVQGQEGFLCRNVAAEVTDGFSDLGGPMNAVQRNGGKDVSVLVNSTGCVAFTMGYDSQCADDSSRYLSLAQSKR